MAFAPPAIPRFMRAAAGLVVSGAAGAHGGEPTWSTVAWASAWLGALGNPRSRHLASTALQALGLPSGHMPAFGLAWHLWRAQATDAALARQADRLNTAWDGN